MAARRGLSNLALRASGFYASRTSISGGKPQLIAHQIAEAFPLK